MHCIIFQKGAETVQVSFDGSHTSFIIITYFSFRGSAQDYKIHMDMEIVMFA